jgi:hypothetical protein
MTSHPLTLYSPQELEASRRIAAALWLVTAVLCALLAAWSTGPGWTA